MSYIKDTNDFLSKLKNLRKIQENAFLVTADIAGLYPSILYDEGLKALRMQFNVFDNKFILTEDLVNMAEFVLKNNYCKFNSTVKHQILRTAIGTNVLHCMDASLWITLKENVSKVKKFSLGFGLDILMIYFFHLNN